jgi:hypothetical protein
MRTKRSNREELRARAKRIATKRIKPPLRMTQPAARSAAVVLPHDHLGPDEPVTCAESVPEGETGVNEGRPEDHFWGWRRAGRRSCTSWAIAPIMSKTASASDRLGSRRLINSIPRNIAQIAYADCRTGTNDPSG